MALRKKMVQAVAANPSARPRHEVLNVALYIEKKKTSFMEFYQDGWWQSVEDYFTEKASPDIKKKYRTFAAKKNWIKDDRGKEGVVIIEDDKRRKVRVGTNCSTSSVKTSEHETRQTRDEHFEKESAGLLNVKFNTQDGRAKEAEALGQDPTPEEQEADQQPDTDKIESDSDSDDGWNFNPKDQEEIPNAKRARAPRAKQETAGKRTGSAGAAKLLQGKQLLDTLSSMTALGMWDGTIKEKDVSNRLQKARQLSEFLEQEGSDEHVSVAKSLATSANTIEETANTLEAVQFTKPCVELQNVDGPLLDRLCNLPADCLTAVLTSASRKLVEDKGLLK
ncbi:unnamed protein product, partial [Durusdinium trenchii]